MKCYHYLGVVKVRMDYSQLGKNIAKYRKSNGLTQEKLAEFTGLSNNHISNIENNYSIPSIETLMKLCEALDITPNFLLLGTTISDCGTLKDEVVQKLPLCNNKQMSLLNSFVDWVIDQKI